MLALFEFEFVCVDRHKLALMSKHTQTHTHICKCTERKRAVDDGKGKHRLEVNRSFESKWVEKITMNTDGHSFIHSPLLYSCFQHTAVPYRSKYQIELKSDMNRRLSETIPFSHIRVNE